MWWSWRLLLLCVAVQVTRGEPGGRRGAGAHNRRAKFLSVFQIVRFPNDACNTNDGRTGTCFTEAECSSKGGTNAGSCAEGFGVCCLFTIGCGEMSNENCTYFESDADTPEDGQCSATICPCGDNICQLRLDFNSFVITGPSMNTLSVTKLTANAGVLGPDTPASAVGRCLTDTFSVSGPDGSNPPIICGTNNGEHVYVESSDCCNTLDFQLGANAVDAALANRQWSIKVTQFSCEFPNLAPTGCTQYFFDPDTNTGNVMSFNFDGGDGLHLANQDQQICIRRERNYCRICFTAVDDDDFEVSGTTAGSGLNTGTLCCSYLNAGSTKNGFDCIQIPGALTSGVNPVPARSNLCGAKGLKVTKIGGGATLDGAVCTTHTPFRLNFRSDNFEVTGDPTFEAGNLNPGFNLMYTMDNVGCDP